MPTDPLSMPPHQGRSVGLPAASRLQKIIGTKNFPFRFGLGITLVVVGVYNLMFFNRYLPLTEGWFLAYARLMAEGKVPYRDFYFFMTPLYPLQMEAFLARLETAFSPCAWRASD